ncbi:DHA2 family efflux MFS transporter permease subunit [Bradyrhizobium oligotrophicum S58]
MSASAAPQDRPSLATWLGFVLMCVGMFMAILDIQVVATSLPTIQEALGITPEAMSWIQTAYLIAEIIAIPLTGLLTRVFTLRWLFTGAVGIFTAASLGCAFSGDFHTLLAFRVLQGFFGGLLIPVVFSAVFLLFPPRLHAVATTIGGVVAVLAPTIGPVVGGFITNTWSWPWLFLINIAPGLVAALVTPGLLPKQRMDLAELDKLDLFALLLLAVSLASLELGLKEAPKGGWLSSNCIAFLVLSASCLTLLVQRLLASPHPILRLGSFQRRSFTLGCLSSFCLGIGLFGSVYLMPVFLAFVRGHDAFEIGKIMLVTGVAQLIAAPLVTALDGKVDARLLTAFGFVLFGFGLAASAFQPPTADYQEMFWPQVVRGVGIMFCLLPPTRIALGDLPQTEVADASGLFNLMRNLGGAIGIALIDTVIYGRVAMHAQAFRDRLLAGDTVAAKAIGLAPELLRNRPRGVSEEQAIAYVRPLVEKASLALCVNEAWSLLAGVALLGFLLIPFARSSKAASQSPRMMALEAAQPALRRRLDQLGPRSG